MNFTKATTMKTAAGFVLCAVIAAGCANQIGGGPSPGPDIPGEKPSELTKADSSKLTAVVSALPENDEAAALAARVRTAAESALIGNGFKIAPNKPDVIVGMSVRQSTFDRSGNYYLLEGSVPAAKIAISEDAGKVVASTQFPTVRGERSLGMEKAVASVGDKLAPVVEKWAADSVKPENFDIAAVTVVVKRNTLFYKSKDPVYVTRFAERVSQLDGVYSCQLVAGDAKARLWEFRIVYRKSKFPGGLVNKAIETCRDLDLELNR